MYKKMAINWIFLNILMLLLLVYSYEILIMKFFWLSNIFDDTVGAVFRFECSRSRFRYLVM